MTTMTQEAPAREAPKQRPAPMPRHGVDTPKLFATIDVVKGQPDLAQFQFKATSRWMKGTHCRTTMAAFTGAGGEHQHVAAYQAEMDHPGVLCGQDQGPTPVEYLLAGLAGCITAGVANIAAARGVTLDAVEAEVTGDIDLQGILGISDDVRNGFSAIRATFRVGGDAPTDKLAQIVDQARARSAVFDVLTNGVPVEIKMAD